MKKLILMLCCFAAALAAPHAFAQEAAAAAPSLADQVSALESSSMTAKVAMDTVWVLLTAGLVFFMNTGFGLVESGLCRSKNCVNILSKNFIVFAISSISFYVLGWGLMFGEGTPYFGLKGLWCLLGGDNSPATGDAYKGVYTSINWTGVPLEAKFFFQLVFAGTAATIVSGAVAERIKYISFILFSAVLVAVMYPITGHWLWGGGFLAQKGVWDFAGSTVVHSVGGWAALAGVIALGPRLGKFGKDGQVHPIPGHSMTSAFIGCFVLWLGWFGFNPGSTMGVGDGKLIAHIFVTTNTAAAAGCIGAMATAWLMLKKPDLSMTLNGCLAGLVAITCPCAWVSTPASIVIGLIAGVLVVFAVIMFDKLRLDDPVGALSVHLVNGVWGTLSLGLFAHPNWTDGKTGPGFGLFNGGGITQLVNQATGVFWVGLFTLFGGLIVWYVIKAVMGLRVAEEEETEGLDLGEHGQEAYPDFQPATHG